MPPTGAREKENMGPGATEASVKGTADSPAQAGWRGGGGGWTAVGSNLDNRGRAVPACSHGVTPSQACRTEPSSFSIPDKDGNTESQGWCPGFASGTVVLNVWPPDRYLQPHLEACQKCQGLGPTQTPTTGPSTTGSRRFMLEHAFLADPDVQV